MEPHDALSFRGNTPAWLREAHGNELGTDKILSNISSGFLHKLGAEPDAALDASLENSRTLSACLLARWAEKKDFVDWRDGVAHHVASWLTQPKAEHLLDPTLFRITDPYGLEAHLGKFYDPYIRGLILFMPASFENFPNGSSVNWTLPWATAITSALAGLRETVRSFFVEMGAQSGLGALLETTRSLEEESDEFYDLGVQSRFYK